MKINDVKNLTSNERKKFDHEKKLISSWEIIKLAM